MDKINFKLSDAAKHDLLWSAINTNYNEENDWAVDYGICDVFDDYALVYDYQNGSYERIYYTKGEDDITIDKREKTFVLDVSEAELAALNAVKAINGGNFEKAEEVYTKVETLENEKAEISTQFEALTSEKQTLEETLATEKENFEQKKIEDEQTIATLQTENEKLSGDIAQFTADKEELTNQLEALHEYQKSEETQKKQAILDKYSAKLPEEAISKYSNFDEYTTEQLAKELAFELVNTNPTIFELEEGSKEHFVPKDNLTSGLTNLLNSYKNGGKD